MLYFMLLYMAVLVDSFRQMPCETIPMKIDGSFIRFALVGVANTIVGTTIMFVFYNVFHLSYWVSSASNYFFGSILSYFLNKNFTFRYGKLDFKSVLRFVLNILFCYLVAYGLAKPLAKSLLPTLPHNIQENIAMIVGLFAFTVLNYLGQRFFAFKKQQ